MAGEMKNSFELNTGANMPLIGLGTWQSQPGIVAKAVDFAVRHAGYRHIDCAHVYDNEKEIGEALKKLFEEGVVKRKDMFITSKLWYGDHPPEDASLAFEAIQKSLNDLQLDYLDLYLVHWPLHVKRGAPGESVIIVPMDIPSTWTAMEAIYDSGKARAIGVSNFSTNKLGDLLEIARVPPAVNQVECHPVWQQPKLHTLCKSKGVHLSAWSPLGNPGTFGGNFLAHPVVIDIAESLGRTPAQIVLRWGLQAGHGVLPKSSNEERIKENFDIFGWSIPDDLMANFSEIKQERLVKAERYLRATGPYKTLEEFWDGEV